MEMEMPWDGDICMDGNRLPKQVIEWISSRKTKERKIKDNIGDGSMEVRGIWQKNNRITEENSN